MEREINRPRFYWALPNEELPDGFGNLMASPMGIVIDGYQPCDACGQIEYTEETACSQPDAWREDKPPYQHCQCWYDCEPCHKCGNHPVVLYGPPFPWS